MLNSHDVSEYLKMAPNGLEVGIAVYFMCLFSLSFKAWSYRLRNTGPMCSINIRCCYL